MSIAAPEVQHFIRAACPTEWASSAEELASAAVALFRAGADAIVLRYDTERDLLRKSAHSRSALLLAAFSIENGLKALLVAADPSHVNTGVLSKSLTRHDLPALARDVSDFTWDEADLALLALLSRALPAWGRYPIAKSMAGDRAEVVFDEIAARRFWRLHRRLTRTLYSRVHAGWDSGVGVRLTSVEISHSPDEWDVPPET